jgi:hypothetical protein
LKGDYRAWSPKTRPINRTFINLGQIDHEELTDGSREVPFPGVNYWEAEYPINLNYYPQTECEIYQCAVCGGILLIYTEYSGHCPQERVRWLQRELVSNASS